MSTRRVFRAPLAAVLALVTTACTVSVSDLGKYEVAAPKSRNDVSLQLASMGLHWNQRVEFRIVVDEGRSRNQLVYRAIFEPLGAPESLVLLAGAAPAGQRLRLDLWADYNGTPGYQTPLGGGAGSVGDHSWSLPLVPASGPGFAVNVDRFTGTWKVGFDHGFPLNDLVEENIGAKNFSITFQGIQVLNGAPTTVRLRVNGNVIGLYRILPDDLLVRDRFRADPTLVLENLVDVSQAASSYTAEVYVDANRNGRYDNPATGGGDLGWKSIPVQLDVALGARATWRLDDPTNPGIQDVGP